MVVFLVLVLVYHFIFTVDRDSGNNLKIFHHVPVITILHVNATEEQIYVVFFPSPANICFCCLRGSLLFWQCAHYGCWTHN